MSRRHALTLGGTFVLLSLAPSAAADHGPGGIPTCTITGGDSPQGFLGCVLSPAGEIGHATDLDCWPVGYVITPSPTVSFNGTCAILSATEPLPPPVKELVRPQLLGAWGSALWAKDQALTLACQVLSSPGTVFGPTANSGSSDPGLPLAAGSEPLGLPFENFHDPPGYACTFLHENGGSLR